MIKLMYHTFKDMYCKGNVAVTSNERKESNSSTFEEEKNNTQTESVSDVEQCLEEEEIDDTSEEKQKRKKPIEIKTMLYVFRISFIRNLQVKDQKTMT